MDHAEVEVDVIDVQAGDLAEAHSTVDEHPQEGGVLPGIEGLALARLQELLEVMIFRPQGRAPPARTVVTVGHRGCCYLTVLHGPLEELQEIAVAHRCPQQLGDVVYRQGFGVGSMVQVGSLLW